MRQGWQFAAPHGGNHRRVRRMQNGDGRRFQGAALHELEKAGIELWEVDGDPAALLDTILFEEEKAAQQADKSTALPFPVLENLGEGRYSLSIAEVQRSSGGLTSKQVLLPILQQDLFANWQSCAHMCRLVGSGSEQPWLATAHGKTGEILFTAISEVNSK